MTNTLKKLIINGGEYNLPSGTSYSAGKNVSISSNTINSDSTSMLTQSAYDNLPSSKNSDDKTYFIYDSLLSYSEIVDMATNEGYDPNARTNTLATLNSAPTGYYNEFNDGGHLTLRSLSYPSSTYTIDGISYTQGTKIHYIAYNNGTWVDGYKNNK